MTDTRGERVHERYGWVLLSVSAILGLLMALVVTIAPTSVMDNPEFLVGSVPGVIRFMGVSTLFFHILALVVILTSFRARERWAWFALWLLPLLWLADLVINPNIRALVLALIGAVGLMLAYRRFFSASYEGEPSQPSRVR